MERNFYLTQKNAGKICRIATAVLFLLAFFLSGNAAASGENYWNRAVRNIVETWNSGTYDLYVPVHTWHNRLFYDREHIDKYNEEPWGIGFGKSRYDEDGDWHGLYAMGFKDSNRYLQTIFGYAYQKNWTLDENKDWKIGVGITLSVTQRHEYNYIPLPLPLPIAGLTYKRLSIQAAYVPGVKNDGNILFTWLRWQLN